VGFRQIAVEYVREERFAGETKYPLRKMFRFAADAVTSFSYKPLKLAIFVGFGLSLASFMYLLVVLYLRLFTDRTVEGWTSIVAMNLLFNGIMLVILGIIGEYIGRIYEESKNRPLYIIREIIENEHKAEGRD
jgi:polyisoprenyl-phosphate glycosyltransferase